MDRDDDLAIITLCSQMCLNEHKPLEQKEWEELSKKLIEAKKTPKDLFDFLYEDFFNDLKIENVEYIRRIQGLLLRCSSLAFEIEKLSSMGINVVTRASRNYPSKLKSVLGQQSPPLFYYAGDLGLLNKKFIGFVGSRDITDEDKKSLDRLVKTAVSKGYGIVSGGAKGVDSFSTDESIKNGGFAVEYVSDSMISKLKNHTISSNIRNGNLLILSCVKPDVGFNVGIAMQRNKYIYAQSEATVVVKSQYNKGGTWTGAVENLKKGWVKEYCLNNNATGNNELIKIGAIPISENFDFDIDVNSIKISKQQSMFD